MTREMNSGLSAEGERVAYPFNADNQVQPDWEQIRYAYLHPTENIEVISTMPELDDWIKPFVDSVNERFKKND